MTLSVSLRIAQYPESLVGEVQLDKICILRRIDDKRITQREAAEQIGLSPRQIRRILVQILVIMIMTFTSLTFFKTLTIPCGTLSNKAFLCMPILLSLTGCLILPLVLHDIVFVLSTIML